MDSKEIKSLPVGGQDSNAATPTGGQADLEESSKGRRQLIKAGLIGAPLVVTLRGRTAWAGSGNSSGSLASLELPSDDS